MVSILEFCLLGPWRAQLNGEPIPDLPTRHSRALLARLALTHPARIPRAELIKDLFPHITPASAAHRLRSTIYYLRRSIPGLLVTIDDQIGLDPGATVVHDVSRFEAESAPGASLASLESAIALYRGHFLENSPGGWAFHEAHRLRGRYLSVLQAVVSLAQSSGDPASGLDAARRWQEEEPWEENAQIAYIRALIACGHYQAAKVQLYRAIALLGADVSRPPGPAFQSLSRELNRLAADQTFRPARQTTREFPPQALMEPSPEYRGALVGRKSELFALEQAWAGANRGESRAIVIEAAAGIGKSQLVEEFVSRLRFRSDILFFSGVANERTSDLRLGLFRDAFRSLTTEMAGVICDSWAALDEWNRSRLIQLIPEIRSLLPHHFMPSHPGETEAIEKAARNQTLITFFDHLCTQQNVVLVFEDCHFADEESCDLVRELIRSDRHLLLVVTQQPMTSGMNAPLNSELAGENEKITRLRLPPFSSSESESLVRQILGDRVEKGLSEQLHIWSGGVALFIKEIIRTLHERGDLVWSASNVWAFRHEDIRLPSQMSDVLQDRLAGLSLAALETAQIFALINRPVEAVLLDHLWPDRHVRLAAQAELLRKQVVIEVGERLALAHVWLGDTIRASIDRAARDNGHARIAFALAAIPSADLAERAYHHDQSGDWETALELALAVSQQAIGDGRSTELGKMLPLVEKCLANGSVEDSDPRRWRFLTLQERYYAIVERGSAWLRSLDNLAAMARENHNTDWMVDALTRLGRAQRELGKQDEAERSLRQAADLARQIGSQREAIARALLSTVLDDRGSAKEALFEAEQAHKLISDSEDDVTRLRIVFNLAYMRMRMGQVDKARQAMEALLTDPAIPSRPALQARIVRQLGIIQIAARDYEIGLDSLRQSVQIARQTGDLQTSLICQTSLVYELGRFGLFAEGFPLAEATLDLAKRLKANTQISTILNTLAGIAFHRGDPDQAWTLAQESVSSAEAIGLPEYLASSLGMQAVVALGLGHLHSAVEAVLRAERIMATVKHPTLLTIDHIAARVWLASGERQRAVESAHRAVHQVVETGIPAIETIGVLWEAANIISEVEGSAPAQPIYIRASERLVRDMGRLNSLALRQAFLDAHPAHRALLDFPCKSSEGLVQLPLLGAPTGRSLHMDELAPVIWTVHAPDDLPLSTTSGRHQRLQRLCAQAKEQGTLATVEQLARILSVSTRTVQRDLKNLRLAGRTVETYGEPSGF